MPQETDPITADELRKSASNPDRAIPGQSLTNNPENPAPYEKAPEFTSKDEALQYFMQFITSEENYDNVMEMLREGTEVMTVVEALLVKSFRDGQINPDMVLLLAEPLAYLLIGLAEREGIRAVIVNDDDDPENPGEPWQDDAPPGRNILKDKARSGVEPPTKEKLNLDETIKNTPSLMARKPSPREEENLGA